MKTLLSLMALLTSAAFSNPIATPPVKEATVRKTWERCVISVGPNSATVSCAVGYSAKKFLDHPVYVTVPIFFAEGTADNPEKLGNLVRPRLETGGKVLEPQWISSGGISGIPGVLKGECQFLVGQVPDKAFSIVVSYEQPAIKGCIYYLPLFEGGISPTIADDFDVTFFPTKGGSLSLKSEHRNKVTAYQTRITVHPLHNEIIKVVTTNSEQPVDSNPH